MESTNKKNYWDTIYDTKQYNKDGPKKCSGLDIKQYSEESMLLIFERYFEKIKCIQEDHTTPFNTSQNFLFCSFIKK